MARRQLRWRKGEFVLRPIILFYILLVTALFAYRDTHGMQPRALRCVTGQPGWARWCGLAAPRVLFRSLRRAHVQALRTFRQCACRMRKSDGVCKPVCMQLVR